MRRALVILSACSCAAILALPALAGPPVVATVELEPGRDAGSAGRPFTLAGVHWRGKGRVVFRTRSLAGGWSAWRPAAPEDEDGPDLGSGEQRLEDGWRIGNPWWVGASDWIQTRTIGQVSRVRAHLVWSPELRVPYRTPATTIAPAIVPRLSWGADESIRRAPPSFAPAVRFSVVHHTAGRNDYTRAEAAAIVKGIQLFHVQSNGWNDIGYNFLVDRFGTIYEGRYGGTEKNVVGAHAQGFNTGSVGVALLGTYGSATPSRAAQDAIAELLAWRLDLAHVDPMALTTFISGGSNRYASGTPVLLRSVSGHRDAGLTECPGDALYGRLNALAASSAGIGLPKVYEPRVDSAEGIYRFRARLSTALPWVVSIRDAAGLEIARGAGTGTAVDWSWDSVLAPSGRYTWSIGAGAARSATGPLSLAGGTAALTIAATASPQGITPNGDGQADAAVVEYELTAPANLTVEVVDGAGAVAATIVDRVWTRPGPRTVTVAGDALPDGLYSVVLTARTPAGFEAQTTVPLTVSRTLGLVTLTPAAFSPNGDGRNDRLEVRFSLTAPADVRLRVFREGRWVTSPVAASYLAAGSQRLVWNGVRASGELRDGDYSALLEATDGIGTVSAEVPFVSDTLAPRVEILPGRRLRLRVSEPVRLLLRVDGATLKHEAKRAGVVRIPWSGPARRVRVVAWDVAGNTSGQVVSVARPGSAGSGE
jgi:hypothetical protein